MPTDQQHPFFTILTASRDSGKSIRKTIESIKRQTFQSYEHIVIDGGSTDESLSILNEYKGTYPLSWLSDPDQGIADALNKGLRRAQGTYIVVIQADDQLWHPTTLEQLYPILKTERYDICLFPIISDHPRWGKLIKKPFPWIWWYRFKFACSHQGTFVHRRAYDRIGEFRKEFTIALDYDFLYRALNTNARIRSFRDTEPVALVGREGVSSQEKNLIHRLNEKNFFWKTLQGIFHFLYTPYKLKLRHLIRKEFRRPAGKE
jgi:glycosyltransferase involved in cell wall biosynthesis